MLSLFQHTSPAPTTPTRTPAWAEFVLRSAKPFDRAVLIYPLCVAGCVTIITWFMPRLTPRTHAHFQCARFTYEY